MIISLIIIKRFSVFVKKEQGVEPLNLGFMDNCHFIVTVISVLGQ